MKDSLHAAMRQRGLGDVTILKTAELMNLAKPAQLSMVRGRHREVRHPLVFKQPLARLLSVPHLLLGGILILSATLSLFRLGFRSLWLDEATSVALARLDWQSLGKVLRLQEANMALYYGLLHLWIILGDNEFTIRMLSSVMAIAAVAAIYFLGTRLFGARVGLIAAFLLTVNAYHVQYAQEARSYSLLLLLAILAALTFVRSIEQPSRRNWMSYVLSAALGGYAHLVGVLVIVAHGISLAVTDRRRVAWKAFVVSVGIIGVLLSPLVVFAVRGDHGQLAWIPKPNVRRVLDLFYALTGSEPAKVAGADPTMAKGLLVLYSAASLVGLGAGVKQSRLLPWSHAAWRFWFLSAWFLVPIALVLGVSTVKPIFLPKYLIICLPPLIVLAAAGISKIPGKLGLAAVLAIALVMAANEDALYYGQPSKEDWRGAVGYVLSHNLAGDALVFFPSYLKQPYDYYHARLSPTNEPAVAYPAHWRWTSGQPDGLADESLKDLPAHYSRIWLLSRTDDVPDPRLLASLGQTYVRMAELEFPNVRVALYGRAR